MNNEDIGNPRHHSPSKTQRKREKRTKETKMPLLLFESTDEEPSQGSFFLEISRLVFACSADSVKLLKRLDGSPFKTISM